MNPTPDTPPPKWLKRIQHGSWEPEILLSGLIVFSLFQAPEALENLHAYLNRELGLFSGTMNVVLFLETAVYWLIIGFLMQLILRGVWIGLVGLSYIFPKGIKMENLPYAPRFKEYIGKNTDIVSRAIRVEKISSGVFSLAFLFFMSTLGAAILFAFFGFGTGYIIWKLGAGEGSLVWNIFEIGFTVLFLVYLFDFLSLGLIKRIRWLAPVYYPIYRVFNFFSLSFTYRHIYYSFVSNVSKWKIFWFMLGYIILSVGLLIVLQNGNNSSIGIFSNVSLYNQSRGTSLFHGHYESLNDGNYSVRAHIQSDIISGNTIRLFVAHNVWYEDSIKSYCGYDESLDDIQRDSMELACMAQFYLVELDDSLYLDQKWLFHEKQQTEQKGILTWIDVSHLEKGIHTLAIKPGHPFYTRKHAVIPFYKE